MRLHALASSDFDHCRALLCWYLRQFDCRYGIRGIPSLVIVGPDGRVITEDGRERVSRDPYGSDFPWYPSAHRKQQCEQALSAYKMTLGTALGSSSQDSAAGAGGAAGERTIQVRDGRKYTVGEVATFKQATNTVTGRVVSNTPNPKVTAPDAATIVLDTSVNNNNNNTNDHDDDSAPASGAPVDGRPQSVAAASPRRSAAALAAERRAANLPSSPSLDNSTGTSGSSTGVSASTGSASSLGSGGSTLTVAPSPEPMDLGPVPRQEAPTPGVSTRPYPLDFVSVRMCAE